jgi:UDP-4-amino-4,6-dideoxy-N-acetyl-beta-L-altrosamine transaminase
MPAPLPYGRHCIEDDDVAAVEAVLRGEWLTTGPAVARFEAALAEQVGARHALACSSGTAALHLAALALGLAPGERVVVPTLTFLATANAPRHAGAEIVFADVDADTGLMHAHHLEDALARAKAGGAPVRAAFPVQLNGQAADLEAIAEICRSRGITVVHDAAHALGTTYAAGGERAVGNGVDAAMAAFSFHPVKVVAMGEGGAVTTDDDALAGHLARLRNHGMTSDAGRFENPALGLDASGAPNPWYYEMAEPGFNYRASDIHCALGLSQLAKLARFVARRRALAARYDALLAPLAPAVRPLARIAGCRPAWHLYVVLVDFAGLGRPRSEVMRALAERGVATQVHYLPVHHQPYYRARYGALDLPGADAYYERALSLPLFPAMADGDVERVVGALAEALE